MPPLTVERDVTYRRLWLAQNLPKYSTTKFIIIIGIVLFAVHALDRRKQLEICWRSFDFYQREQNLANLCFYTVFLQALGMEFIRNFHIYVFVYVAETIYMYVLRMYTIKTCVDSLTEQ